MAAGYDPSSVVAPAFQHRRNPHLSVHNQRDHEAQSKVGRAVRCALPCVRQKTSGVQRTARPTKTVVPAQ